MEENHLEIPSQSSELKYDPLPEGKYTIVALDIDTTGKRLIDEIVQLAVYSPDLQYSQYIMPLMNLNPAARQRHQVRVITVGFFRMLKSMQTYKVMRTKTEIAALNEFLSYLEKIKDADQESKGIILLFHEQRKFVPYMVIEAMKKYNLLTKFLGLVKSFVNTYPIAVEKCGNSMKYLSLRQTAKVLLNPNNNDPEQPKIEQQPQEGTSTEQVDPSASAQADAKDEIEPFEGNAAVRAQLSFELGQQLARGIESKEEISPEMLTDKFMRLALSYAHSVDIEIEELKEQERILERQSSLRPIFLLYFRTTLHHRVKAVTFRRVLAELGYNMENLQALWQESNKDGLMKAVSVAEELKQEDREELVEILDHHFDPEKEPIKPHVIRRGGRSSRRRRSIGTNQRKEDQNNNVIKNKENLASNGNFNQNSAAGGDGPGPKGQRAKKSPRRSFRRNRNMNRGIAAAN